MAAISPLRAVPDLRSEPRPQPRAVPPGCVRRPRLIARLQESCAPLLIVAAPVGYGKTTLLQQWAEEDERPFVWVTLTADDNDPVSLLGAVPEPLGEPMVVVLDDAHVLESASALRALRMLAEQTPDGSVLAIASRGTPLRLGRLRAAGLVTEIGSADLAMTDAEGATFLRRAGLELTAAETELVVRRAEGWPAGLRLAALALREQDGREGAAVRFAGDDHFVADYLRDELLSQLDPDDVAFLTATSLLDPLTGPLCDAVLDRHDSSRVLQELAHANALLEALDRSEERFRTHRMLADTLRLELRRSEPAREVEIHRRASAWYEAQGELVPAIEHATAARDARRAGALLLRVAPAHVANGRVDALRGWLDRFGDADIAAHPALAATAALSCVAAGDRDAAERCADTAERSSTAAEPSVIAMLTLVRATVARGSIGRMADDAERAYALADPDSPLRPSACLLVGAARRLVGDCEGARVAFDEGARRAGPAPSVAAAQCLAQLALLAIDEGDRPRAEQLAGRARARIATVEDPAAAPVLAVAALAFALGDRVADARRDARAARRLLGATDIAPWSAAQTRVVLARAELRLSDCASACDLLTEASRMARSIPDATALQNAIADAWEQADTFAVGAVAGPTSLTTAELRVLRFLPSHLSFREIAARLHVSANTVKSQAHAVYRKLDASSRSEAVARARAVGLVDG